MLCIDLHLPRFAYCSRFVFKNQLLHEHNTAITHFMQIEYFVHVFV